MKIRLALLGALCLTTGSLQAQFFGVNPAYQPTPFLTHSSSDGIVSYDWASNGSVYYHTSNSSFNFAGLYQYSGGNPVQVVPGSQDFSGTSLVAICNYVYFNTSDFTNTNLRRYGPVNGSPTSTLISTTPNYGLYTNQGNLFITGAPNFGTNHIYYTGVTANGGLANNPPIDLGEDSGSSGPLAFDLQGNLFYAPGLGDLSIYRWTAAEVSAAILNPTANPLDDAGHRWLDYSSIYPSLSPNSYGGTSLLLDQEGDLLLTITSFSDPSILAKFGIGGDGAFDGTSSTLLQNSERLGDLRLHDGALYLSSGNQIFQLVPEPPVTALFAFAAMIGALVLSRRIRARS